MSSEPEPSARELTPVETAAILRRILDAVEKDERKRWVEITCAIVLSLATMASAWCAYQSTLWGGVQTFRLAAVGQAGRESAEQSIAAIQFRAFDAQMFITFVEAKGRGDEKLATFWQERFRPEARKALDAWLQTNPFNDPNAPKHPFRMAEYVQQELQEARRLAEESARMLAAAQVANETSDRYVLLTVLFASVLFLGGIGGTFQSRRLRLVVFVIAVLLFLSIVIVLGTMPICRE